MNNQGAQNSGRAGHVMNAILTVVAVMSLIGAGVGVYNSMDHRLTIVETTQHNEIESRKEMRRDIHDQFGTLNSKLDKLTDYLMNDQEHRK